MLHCIRSLVNRVTKSTPHDRFLSFSRRFSPTASSFPLEVGQYAWLRRYVRHKNDKTGSLVKIIAAYPGYAEVSNEEGNTTDIVNWRHLAPHPGPSVEATRQTPENVTQEDNSASLLPSAASVPSASPSDLSSRASPSSLEGSNTVIKTGTGEIVTRSGRLSKPPERLGF